MVDAAIIAPARVLAHQLAIGQQRCDTTARSRWATPDVDIQMRTNVPHIFAIGDIVGQPMLAHKAVHEEHVAAEVIAGEPQGNKELAGSA